MSWKNNFKSAHAEFEKQRSKQKARRLQDIHGWMIHHVVTWNSEVKLLEANGDGFLAAEKFVAIKRRCDWHFAVPQPLWKILHAKRMTCYFLNIAAPRKKWGSRSKRDIKIIVLGTFARSIDSTIVFAISAPQTHSGYRKVFLICGGRPQK